MGKGCVYATDGESGILELGLMEAARGSSAETLLGQFCLRRRGVSSPDMGLL